jgi:hypothetical protein
LSETVNFGLKNVFVFHLQQFLTIIPTFKPIIRCHDIQHNDTRHNDTQHNES